MNELSQLENRIKDKIAQTKHKMHMTQERTVTDRLWPEIETLNCVLNEILILSRDLDHVRMDKINGLYRLAHTR